MKVWCRYRGIETRRRDGKETEDQFRESTKLIQEKGKQRETKRSRGLLVIFCGLRAFPGNPQVSEPSGRAALRIFEPCGREPPGSRTLPARALPWTQARAAPGGPSPPGPSPREQRREVTAGLLRARNLPREKRSSPKSGPERPARGRVPRLTATRPQMPCGLGPCRASPGCGPGAARARKRGSP